MNWKQRFFGRLAVEQEMIRRRAIFAHLTGDLATADRLLTCAKTCAHRLAVAVLNPAAELLPIILDEITRRLAAGLPVDYIVERVDGLQSVQELQAMAILGTLEPLGMADLEEEPLPVAQDERGAE